MSSYNYFSTQGKFISLTALVFISIITIGLSLSCKDTITNPPPEDHPPGYQQDIPWPSMDKNPWPIHNGNAQLNGRSRFSGPVQGVVEWKIEIPVKVIQDDSYLSPVCDDSTIYVVTFWDNDSSLTNLRAIGFDGVTRWKLPLESDNPDGKVTTEPVLASDGTIYVADWANKVMAVNSDGTIKWEINIAPQMQKSQMNLDKEGNLYFFANSGILHKVSPSGERIWRIALSNFGSSGSSVAFAPDGKTLYVTGYDLYAVSTDGELKWKYEPPSDVGNLWDTTPVVDAYGNIYINGGSIILNSRGELLPFLDYPDSIKNFYLNEYISPTVDKNGNIYRGELGIISHDYTRKFKWSKNIPLQLFYSIVSDKDNNIYYLGNDNKLICIDLNGTIKWELQLDGRYYYSPAIVNGRMFLITVRGTNRYLYSIK